MSVFVVAAWNLAVFAPFHQLSIVVGTPLDTAGKDNGFTVTSFTLAVILFSHVCSPLSVFFFFSPSDGLSCAAVRVILPPHVGKEAETS